MDHSSTTLGPLVILLASTKLCWATLDVINTVTIGVGIPVLIRHYTANNGTSDQWSTAADAQLNYLLNVIPRTSDGAISQRVPPQPVQLWADFMSMAPPFIAYYG
jgi:rhamnogalacturonyl hydrolase YesR